MTDTITPASLRAHADWFDTTFETGSVEARSLRNCAARLEAESARDEYVETLAKVQHMAADDFMSGFATWDELSDSAQAAYRVGMRAVLDRLAADGRLLPEGGTLAEAWDRGWNDCNHWWHDGEVAGEEPNNPYLDTPPAVCVPDSGPDGTPEKPEKWAVLNPDTNTIGPEVFWSWDEADKRGGYGRVVRVDGDKA